MPKRLSDEERKARKMVREARKNAREQRRAYKLEHSTIFNRGNNRGYLCGRASRAGPEIWQAVIDKKISPYRGAVLGGTHAETRMVWMNLDPSEAIAKLIDRFGEEYVDALIAARAEAGFLVRLPKDPKEALAAIQQACGEEYVAAMRRSEAWVAARRTLPQLAG